MAKILVVDEEPMIHEVVEAALEDQAHEVVGCVDTASALAAAEEPIDLLLLHRGLPEDRCLELVARCRRAGDPAIVLLSSQENLESERNKLRLGAGEILYKPIDPVVLRGVVERQLSRNQARLEVPKSPRLLVVDDDPLVKAAVVDILEDNGFEVVAAPSAHRALELLAERPIEIVLTDVMMQGLSGIDLLASLPSVAPNTRAVVMTGYASKDLAVQALRRGASDLLEKPLTPDLVLRAVERTWRLQRYELDNMRLLGELRRINQELLLAKEAAEAASRAKSDFLATISHEVRTPLNGVLGCLDLLEGTPLDNSQEQFLAGAQKSGRALLSMLTDVLDYVSVQGSAPVPDLDPVDPGALVTACVEKARPRVAEAGLELALEVGESVPEEVVLDSRRVERVLDNLLDNARKFTRSGGIGVRLEGGEGQIRIVVHDTGEGMAPEQREAIFQPFYQVDGGPTRQVGGTGLGLALCRSLVRAMGGEIEVSSEPGRGSEFVVTLPVRPRPSEPSEAEGPITVPAEESARAPRALLADDDASNTFVLEKMLDRLGFEVVKAENGQQALDQFGGGPFDLVLLDYQMPVLDGPATAIRLRQLEREAGWPPSLLVAVTGFGLEEHEEKCRESGFDRFLTKPLRFARLQELTAEQRGRSRASNG